ncbi:hypothetical protein GWN75_22045, partial [candidate division KSB1 bacterium]|nr:hypothetical protein [candidate division KSB1 bacterium]NIU27147.1 hypothetical protein [candidate division KSB1 bacterium]NIW21037.1 hypothetical protein [candidate division KSB1 bacterium]
PKVAAQQADALPIGWQPPSYKLEWDTATYGPVPEEIINYIRQNIQHFVTPQGYLHLQVQTIQGGRVWAKLFSQFSFHDMWLFAAVRETLKIICQEKPKAYGTCSQYIAASENHVTTAPPLAPPTKPDQPAPTPTKPGTTIDVAITDKERKEKVGLPWLTFALVGGALISSYALYKALTKPKEQAA